MGWPVDQELGSGLAGQLCLKVSCDIAGRVFQTAVT